MAANPRVDWAREAEPTQAPQSFFLERPGIFKIHRRVYVDPEIFAREQELIFGRCWLYVGHESEVPRRGDFLTRRTGGRPIIMVRGNDNRIRVLLNTCTHRGAQVCRERAGNAKTFQCFYHAWTYDNQGALIGVPGAEAYGPGFDRTDLGLREVRSDNYRGLVFMCLSAETEPLVEYLAGAREQLDLMLDQGDELGMEVVKGSHQYSMPANWKMLMENTLDGYHANTTHRRFFFEYAPEVLGIKSDPNGRGGMALDLGNGHTTLQNAKFNAFDAGKRKQWENRFGVERTHLMLDFNRQLLLFPNTLFIEIWQAVRTCNPVTPNYMEVNAWALFPKSDTPAVRKQRLDVYEAFLGPGGHATPDDCEVLEECQGGFAAIDEVPWSDDSRGLTWEQPRSDHELQMRVFFKHWDKLINSGR